MPSLSRNCQYKAVVIEKAKVISILPISMPCSRVRLGTALSPGVPLHVRSSYGMILHMPTVKDEARSGSRPKSYSNKALRSAIGPPLGPTEFRLLEFLMQSPARVFSREQLLDGVWGSEVYIDERTVDVHVGRLRKALNRDHSSDPIRTVRGSGYALDDKFAKAG